MSSRQNEYEVVDSSLLSHRVQKELLPKEVKTYRVSPFLTASQNNFVWLKEFQSRQSWLTLKLFRGFRLKAGKLPFSEVKLPAVDKVAMYLGVGQRGSFSSR